MSSSPDYRQGIISYLEDEGLALLPTDTADEYRVVGRTGRVFMYEPVFTLPADLLSEYLHVMSESYRDQPDPLGTAVSLTEMHAMEYLTTDHGDGLNATTALGFRRTEQGDVEFFLEQDPPPIPGREPSPHLRWTL